MRIALAKTASRLGLAAIVSFALATPSWAQQATDTLAPESATKPVLTGDKQTAPVNAKKWMVTAANPLAVEAGSKVLRAGGSAADAAIAVQLVLGLVEPQSSGLGGGAFLVYFDAASGKLTTLDGRETAPKAATPRLFQDENGEPLKFFDAVVGGRSVGVPGTPKLLEEMHKRWGKTEWKSLFADAVGLAESGFVVSPRLEALVAKDKDRLSVHPATSAYFLPDGVPLEAGNILKNPQYATTLQQMAESGSKAFYSGPNVEQVVNAIRSVKVNPGVMAVEDLAVYQVKEREPVCISYRAHDVCGMGPPSSGALTVGQILGLLGRFDMKAMGPNNVETWGLIGDASRLAFADRGRYMADVDFVPLPQAGLLAPAYLAERSALLKPGTTLETVSAGNPKWDHASLLADDESIELPSTSHFSIVDADGNAVSMTTTIENGFGSRVMVNGYLLNNELTDFSFRSHKDGVPIANRVEPGKRPRSSMSPTIVMKDGKPVFVIGSPGGSRIIGYVAKTIIAHLDWGMNVQQAIDLPHLVNRFGTYDVEAGTPAEQFAPALEALGYEVKIRGLNSGLHGIVLTADGLEGGADFRREGRAMGE